MCGLYFKIILIAPPTKQTICFCFCRDVWIYVPTKIYSFADSDITPDLSCIVSFHICEHNSLTIEWFTRRPAYLNYKCRSGALAKAEFLHNWDYHGSVYFLSNSFLIISRKRDSLLLHCIVLSFFCTLILKCGAYFSSSSFIPIIATQER